MPNIASVLKNEISRLARKQLKEDSSSLKKASAQYSTDIAALKRQVQSLERQVAKLLKASAVPVRKNTGGEMKGEGTGTRFSAKRLAAHRARLELSAAEMGMLLNCSGQSVYKWEQGKARPRASNMPAIAALRTLNKAKAAEVLNAISGERAG